VSRGRSKVAALFTTGTRGPGPIVPEVKFVTTAEGAPQWLVDTIYAAHQGDMPRDWIYAECQAAAEAFDAGDLTDEDYLAAHADSRVDIYTADRFRWAAEHCQTRTWAEAEEQAKELAAPGASIETLLGQVQYYAIEFIARTMLDAIREENQRGAEEEAS
jgi:hypothetical protein